MRRAESPPLAEVNPGRPTPSPSTGWRCASGRRVIPIPNCPDICSPPSLSFWAGRRVRVDKDHRLVTENFAPVLHVARRIPHIPCPDFRYFVPHRKPHPPAQHEAELLSLMGVEWIGAAWAGTPPRSAAYSSHPPPLPLSPDTARREATVPPHPS